MPLECNKRFDAFVTTLDAGQAVQVQNAILDEQQHEQEIS